MSAFMKSRVDVLLVTVTKVETEAVLEAAREQTGHEAAFADFDGKVYYDLGEIGGARVGLTRSEMGAGGIGRGPAGDHQGAART